MRLFLKPAGFRKKWSGRRDSNSRPSGPKPDALARLRYAPKKLFLKEKREDMKVNFALIKSGREINKLPPQKSTMFSFISKKTVFFALTFGAFSIELKPAIAWSGYDYDEKTTIEIEPGNLVREGLLIQFYDHKLDKYHAAKITFVDSVSDGTRIQLEDLDSRKERTFIMQFD